MIKTWTQSSSSFRTLGDLREVLQEVADWPDGSSAIVIKESAGSYFVLSITHSGSDA